MHEWALLTGATATLKCATTSFPQPQRMTPFAASTSTPTLHSRIFAQIQLQAPIQRDTILEDALTACLLPLHAGSLWI